MSDPRTPSRAERERLRALAEQARDADDEWYSDTLMADLLGPASQPEATFLAACSPSVVLSLLAALDEGERERERDAATWDAQETARRRAERLATEDSTNV